MINSIPLQALSHIHHNAMKLIRFIKNWTLPLAMLAGVAGYFIYTNLPLSTETRVLANQTVNLLQPLLIFMMLFLSFCKVSLHDLRPCKWHFKELLVQGGSFLILGGLLIAFPDIPGALLIESAMICLICPTATAGAVVTQKLGGNAAHLTTYTILANLLTAVLVPLIVPIVHPHPGLTFGNSFALILGKVFPLLLCPFIAAELIRYLLPKLHQLLIKYTELAFYLWAVALALAIAVTVKSIVHSEISVSYLLGIAIISFICCGVQFYFGKRIGNKYNDTISAGQSLGQKNTVFAIWMGYTFFTPVTAMAGGFYSVWHNLFNAWQLYRQRIQNAPKS